LIYLSLVSILAVLAGACTMLEDSLEGRLPQYDPVWVEEVAPSGWVLFQDSFSDPGSGWDQSEDPDGRREYTDNVYRFTILRPNWYYWASPHLGFSNIHVDVQVNRIGGNGISSQGIFCRYQDDQNFYAFTITSDGYAGISKIEDGRERLLGRDSLHSSANIFTGDAQNFIGVDCIGESLKMWINGIETLEIKDSTFRNGEVGIIASVLEGQFAVIDFDNFSIIKP
jgi:hypothetical protein